MNVRDKPEYVCQKCKERFKISTKMVQHYAKEHKDSDLERTKEDLLLYSSDELEEHYRNDVKVNWKTGMESCENFSNDNVNIETIGKEILFRREMCKNMGHNRCTMEKKAHCEKEPTFYECRLLLRKLFFFAHDQKLNEKESQNWYGLYQGANYEDQIEVEKSPELEPNQENSWIKDQQIWVNTDENIGGFEVEKEEPNNVSRVKRKLLKLDACNPKIVKRLQDFKTEYHSIKSKDSNLRKKLFNKYNKSRKTFCTEQGIGVGLVKELCETELKIESKNGQWIITE